MYYLCICNFLPHHLPRSYCSTLGTTLKILSNTSVGQFLMIARFVWILIGDFKKVDNGAAVGVVDRCATNIVPTMIQVEVVMENWSKRNWKHKGSLWIMVQDHWALTHQLCLHLHTYRRGGNHGHGGSYRQGRGMFFKAFDSVLMLYNIVFFCLLFQYNRSNKQLYLMRKTDYHRKRHREDDHHRSDYPKRSYDRESRRISNHESRPEKNPRFRESGDSDEEEDDDRKRRT
ncbi:uncharacterized protein LOC107777914 isoform X2 [Nicotiana tabacum]|uniref:Uncharacterized protein LOC107777914 isoform X2 n=1 Tax=Nicotiana tabacum TaxID=4097 RepID=A0AC58UMD0_TOBAC